LKPVYIKSAFSRERGGQQVQVEAYGNRSREPFCQAAYCCLLPIWRGRTPAGGLNKDMHPSQPYRAVHCYRLRFVQPYGAVPLSDTDPRSYCNDGSAAVPHVTFPAEQLVLES